VIPPHVRAVRGAERHPRMPASRQGRNNDPSSRALRHTCPCSLILVSGRCFSASPVDRKLRRTRLQGGRVLAPLKRGTAASVCAADRGRIALKQRIQNERVRPATRHPHAFGNRPPRPTVYLWGWMEDRA
jgi:hypothetical protein